MSSNIVNNIFINPSPMQMLGLFVFWFLSMGLGLLAFTDLFMESLFQKKNLIVIVMMILSTIAFLRISVKYMINNFSS